MYHHLTLVLFIIVDVIIIIIRTRNGTSYLQIAMRLGLSGDQS